MLVVLPAAVLVAVALTLAASSRTLPLFPSRILVLGLFIPELAPVPL